MSARWTTIQVRAVLFETLGVIDQPVVVTPLVIAPNTAVVDATRPPEGLLATILSYLGWWSGPKAYGELPDGFEVTDAGRFLGLVEDLTPGDRWLACDHKRAVVVEEGDSGLRVCWRSDEAQYPVVTRGARGHLDLRFADESAVGLQMERADRDAVLAALATE